MIIGKRYYLDPVKDVSGIFIGNEFFFEGRQVKGEFFNEIIGVSPYMVYPGTGVIGFNEWFGFDESTYPAYDEV